MDESQTFTTASIDMFLEYVQDAMCESYENVVRERIAPDVGSRLLEREEIEPLYESPAFNALVNELRGRLGYAALDAGRAIVNRAYIADPQQTVARTRAEFDEMCRISDGEARELRRR